MNIEDIITLRDGMQEQHLWTAAHQARLDKDLPALRVGSEIGATGEEFWNRASNKLALAMQMQQFFELLAEDGDNAYLLIRLMNAAAQATRSVRHPTAGDWVDEQLKCPVCDERIDDSNIMLLSVQDWFAEQAIEDDSPQLLFTPYRFGSNSLAVVMMHDNEDSAIEPCLFNVESATFGHYTESEDSAAIGV